MGTYKRYIGVDVCKSGWIFSCLSEETDQIDVEIAKSLHTAGEYFRKAEIIFIDIPIALPCDRFERECDKIARKILKRRASSVFRVPHVNVSTAKSYREACLINEALTGKKVSRQVWNIFDKILETREFLIENPNFREKFYESHPELCFYHLNNMRNLRYSKHSRSGIEERKQILRRYIDEKKLQQLLQSENLCKFARVDDILDSLAMTAVAKFFRGNYKYIPTESIARDTKGFIFRIVF